MAGASAKRGLLICTVPRLVGAKLQPVAMKKMLFDGDSVRPYMFTRMPQFGESNLKHLPELFARLDTVAKFEFSLPEVESRNEKERARERELRRVQPMLAPAQNGTLAATAPAKGRFRRHRCMTLRLPVLSRRTIGSGTRASPIGHPPGGSRTCSRPTKWRKAQMRRPIWMRAG